MNLPRSDVAAGGLQGVLVVLIMLVLNRQYEFDFTVVEAAVVTIATFAGGYVPTRFKPFFAAVTGAIAVLVTSAIGYVLFQVPFDTALISNAIAAVAVAVVTYRVPPYAGSRLDPEYAVSRNDSTPNTIR